MKALILVTGILVGIAACFLAVPLSGAQVLYACRLTGMAVEAGTLQIHRALTCADERVILEPTGMTAPHPGEGI